MHLSSEAYDVFEQVFQGKDNAKKVMRALEEAIVTTVHDSWYRTKEELKAEVFSLYFALLLFAIIFLNQNALELIAKFIGIVR